MAGTNCHLLLSAVSFRNTTVELPRTAAWKRLEFSTKHRKLFDGAGGSYLAYLQIL